MVVTRKSPHVPAPAVSRTNSSQTTNRNKQQPTQATAKQTPPAAAAGASKAGQHKASNNKLRKQSTKKPPKGFFKKVTEFVASILLLVFAVYSVTTCPSDITLDDPVCRALFSYRKHVLEPFVLPPLLAAYHHPTIQPYVQTAKPYIDNVVDVTVPVIKNAHHQWSTRVVPNWNARVVPQWNKRVIPAWTQYVQPHVAKLEPYRAQANGYISQARDTYDQHVAPPVAYVSQTASTTIRVSTPYVVSAANRSYQVYQFTKPHLVRFFKWNKKGMDALIVITSKYRRELVDPHLVQIWAKVKELSGALPSDVTRTASSHEAEETLGSSPVVEHETATIATLSSSSSSLPPPPITTEDVADPSHAEAPSPIFAEEHPEVDTTPYPELIETVELASSITPTPEVEITQTGSVHPSSSLNFVSSASSVAEDIISAESIASQSVAATVTSSASAPSAAVEEEEEDPLAALYAELGLDPDPISLTPEEIAMQEEFAAPELNTEEMAAEHAANTAKKRADIERRHSEWETKLDVAIKVNLQSLPQTIQSIRQQGAQAIKEDQEISEAVAKLGENGEKYLKGVEGYLTGLSAASKTRDQRTMWEKVITKVDDKFQLELLTLRGMVHDMYQDVVNAELQEVYNTVMEVRSIVEHAHGDLGLDYVWLDDVKTTDWTRYHDLTRTSDKFSEDAQAIQAGTHELSLDPATNVVVKILNDLDAEVQDIVVGFETRLRRFKRNGEKILPGEEGAVGGINDAPEDETTTSASKAPIEDTTSPVEEPVSQNEVPTIVDTPEVSALPIETNPEDAYQTPVFVGDLPGIAFLGRGREEVIEKLKMVDPAEVEARANEIREKAQRVEEKSTANEHVEL